MEKGTSRRRFLLGAGAASLLTGLKVGSPKVTSAAPEGRPSSAPELPKAVDRESQLLRMQRELAKAMAKPVTERSWVMVIDLQKCIGCSACTVACKAENRLPPGVVYRPVLDEEIGEYPNVSRLFTPRPCMQCDDPPCTPVCPVGATFQRPDGVIEINYEKCIGCRRCIPACPYGARTFDLGEMYTHDTPAVQKYETAPSFEYGKTWPRQEGTPPIGKVRKCQFCLHRLDAGILPACVATCIGNATYFGDAHDPDSFVSELVGRQNVKQLKEELGTSPRTYYLT